MGTHTSTLSNQALRDRVVQTVGHVLRLAVTEAFTDRTESVTAAYNTYGSAVSRYSLEDQTALSRARAVYFDAMAEAHGRFTRALQGINQAYVEAMEQAERYWIQDMRLMMDEFMHSTEPDYQRRVARTNFIDLAYRSRVLVARNTYQANYGTLDAHRARAFGIAVNEYNAATTAIYDKRLAETDPEVIDRDRRIASDHDHFKAQVDGAEYVYVEAVRCADSIYDAMMVSLGYVEA